MFLLPIDTFFLMCIVCTVNVCGSETTFIIKRVYIYIYYHETKTNYHYDDYTEAFSKKGTREKKMKIFSLVGMFTYTYYYTLIVHTGIWYRINYTQNSVVSVYVCLLIS